MFNTKNRQWTDNPLWIIFITIFIMTLGDFLSYLLIPEVSKNRAFLYTFNQYFEFIGIWIIVLFTICFFSKDRYIMKEVFKNEKGNNYKNILIGFLAGFLLNMVCAVFAILNKNIVLKFKVFEILPFTGLFIAVFIQSSSEELLCRGFMYQRMLKSNSRPIFAIISNSMLFAFLHIFNDGVGTLAIYDIFVTGLFFSLVVYYYDSLWMAMAIHTTWNFTQSILLGLPNSGASFPYSVFQLDISTTSSSFAYNTEFGLEGTILSSVLMTLCCIFVVLDRGKNKKSPLKSAE